jgi:hypothetical protein
LKKAESSSSNQEVTLTSNDKQSYDHIVDLYETLIQSIRPKLHSNDHAALDVMLTNIHKQLPNDITDQLHSPRLQLPGVTEDAKSPIYVGEASDIYFFKTVRDFMKGRDSAAGDQDSERYDQTEFPAHQPTAFGTPLVFPPQEEAAHYLEIYFSTIHVAYPFLSESAVLVNFERIWAGKFEEKTDQPWLALLSKRASKLKEFKAEMLRLNFCHRCILYVVSS